MAIQGRILELKVPSGGIEAKTEAGQTWITAYVEPRCAYAMFSNTAATRRWLRATLKRMERGMKG